MQYKGHMCIFQSFLHSICAAKIFVQCLMKFCTHCEMIESDAVIFPDTITCTVSFAFVSAMLLPVIPECENLPVF